MCNTTKIRNGNITFHMLHLSLQLRIGYFVMDGLAVGADILYDYQKDSLEAASIRSFGMGLFGKYYYGTAMLKTFVRLEVGYSVISKGTKDIQRFKGFEHNGNISLAYLITKNFAIERSLKYKL